MHILIVEDEYSIARDIEWNCKHILRDQIKSIRIIQTLDNASKYLAKNPIDLLLLDLNLSGKSGFELLKIAVSFSFHTIIISAYTDQAIEAFQYGVLDFIPKPFDENRFRKAIDRYFGIAKREGNCTKFLTVRKQNQHIVLSVEDIVYFRAANYYVEAVLKSNEIEILDKSMNHLAQILPTNYFRIHRSFIVDINSIESFTPVIKGTSKLILKNGVKLSLSKNRFKELRERMNQI